MTLGKKVLLYIGVACAMVGMFCWWYYQPERVVKRRVMALISTLSVPADSGRTARLMKGGQIADFLASEVEFDTPFEEVSGNVERDDISSGFQFVAEKATSIVIEPEEEMSVKVSGDRAEVRLALRAEAKIGTWIKPVDGKYTVELYWQKADDGWRITQSRWQKATP